LVHKSAERTQKTPRLRAGIVEEARRSPALRAAHDGVVAVFLFDARELAGHQIKRAIPRNRNEGLASALFIPAAPSSKPAFADHRLCDACRRIDRGRHGLDQARGIRIALERLDANEAPVLHFRMEGAEVRMMGD